MSKPKDKGYLVWAIRRTDAQLCLREADFFDHWRDALEKKRTFEVMFEPFKWKIFRVEIKEIKP